MAFNQTGMGYIGPNPPNTSVPQLAAALGLNQTGMGYSGMNQMGMGYSGMNQMGMGYGGMNQMGMGCSGMNQMGMGYSGMNQMGMGYSGMNHAGMGYNSMAPPAYVQASGPFPVANNMYGQPRFPMAGAGGLDSGLDLIDPVFPNAGLDLKSKPTTVTCPHCTVNMETKTTSGISDNQWVLVGSICFAGLFFPPLWLGCCFIPLCMPSLKEVKHTCSKCDKHLGTFKPKI